MQVSTVSASSRQGISIVSSMSALRIPERESFDAQLLYPIAQRAKRHAQCLGGRRLVVTRLLQCLHDRLALDFLEMIAQRSAARGTCAGWGRPLRGPQLN